MNTAPPIVTGALNVVLHAKNTAVKDPLAPEIQALLPAMVQAMRAADGIGLAAPQIGQNLRICVIEIDGMLRHFINPSITSASTDKILFEEGCLSLPGEFFAIERSERVTVRYFDEHGQDKKLRARGLLAICLQHELDHLDGILICDRYKHQKNTHAYAL
ncbi:MAG: peptide deformylase [Candidatus Moraniibacteriota bacterium]